jgi:WD40 repeat protein
VSLTPADFLEHPEATYRHPLVCTRADEAAISPDGKQVAALDPERKQAVLFDLASGDLLRRFAAHEGEIYRLAFSADGKRLATCAADNSVQVFDVATGERRQKIVPPEFPKFAERVPGYRPFRPFYNLTESMGAGLESGLEAALVEPWRKRLSHVTAVAFSPDGRQFVSGQYDGSVRLWDAAGRQHRQYCGPRSAYSNEFLPVINTAAFSADGRYVTAADRSGYVRVWETHSGRQVLRFRADAENALSAQFSQDGRHVLTLGRDGVARIWDAKTGKHLRLLYPGESAAVRAACFAAGGEVMTLGADTAVRFWSADTGEELRSLPVGPSFVAKSLLVADPAGASLLTDGLLGLQSRSTSTGLIGHLFRAAEE